MLELKLAHFPQSAALKVAIAVFIATYLLIKIAEKSQNIWACFVRNIVPENLPKSSNLVTLS